MPTTGTTGTTVSSTTAAPDTTAGGSGPDSAALAAGMLAPVDLGGFYRINDPYAAALLATAPCLAGVGAAQVQDGRAFTGLIVPGGHPAVVEVAVSFPGSGSAEVFQSVNAALTSCTSFSADLGGTEVSLPIVPEQVPAVGDASAAYSGKFSVAGGSESLQVAVVLDGKIVLLVVYIDTVPPSNAIYGDLPSTVGAAIGKLA